MAKKPATKKPAAPANKKSEPKKEATKALSTAPAVKAPAKSAPPKKQTSLAGKVLDGAKATVQQVASLAGSVLGQTPAKDKRKK
jgi:hypothetical protein